MSQQQQTVDDSDISWRKAAHERCHGMREVLETVLNLCSKAVTGNLCNNPVLLTFEETVAWTMGLEIGPYTMYMIFICCICHMCISDI